MSDQKRWMVNHRQLLDQIDSVQYTPSQKQAIRGLLKWYFSWAGHENAKEPAILTALAGCGKSFLTAQLIREIVLDKGITYKDDFKVFFVAPTQRVKVVLKNFSDEAELWKICKPQFRTVHSLGGMKVDGVTDEGFIDEAWSIQDDLEADLIVIDEYPMINEKLYMNIQPLIKKFPTLFVGDLNQLPAIDDRNCEIESIPGQSIVNRLHPNNVFNLTESVRFTGSLLTYTHQILDQYGQPWDHDGLGGRVALPSDDLLDGTLMIERDREALLQKLPDLLKKYEALEGLYNFKVLCYSNSQVEYWNKFIRRILFPDDFQRFHEVDMMLVRSPIYDVQYNAEKDRDEFVRLFHTNESFRPAAIKEGQIIDFMDVPNKKVIKGLEFQLVYATTAWGSQVEIKSPMPESFAKIQKYSKAVLEDIQTEEDPKVRRRRYNDLVNTLKVYGVAYKNDPNDPKPFKRQIIPFYAATLHSTQGSSINHVLVDWENMHEARGQVNAEMSKEEATIDMRRRLAYVACSRGKKTCTII